MSVEQDPLPPWQWLLGRLCWGVAAGAGTGRHVSLHFGHKLRRARELSNPTLQPDLLIYQGEVILFIECKWSIHADHKVLFDSESDDGADQMVKALHELVGKSVSEIRPMLPPHELSLTLNDRIRLDIRADEEDPHDAHDNYTLIVPDKSYVIGSNRRLRIERRTGVLETIESKSAQGQKRGHERGLPQQLRNRQSRRNAKS